MKPEDQWARTQALFEQAVELEPAARHAFVEKESGDDAALRAELLAMLDAEPLAPEWMSALEQRVAEEICQQLDPTPSAPENRFGPYRIVREIGRGGMGTVYLAERDDGQFEQRAAIKVLRASILDPDTTKRFLAERRLLSSFEHPSIARLYDGGITASGVPYFVMEYIDGHPIHEHAAGLDLDTRLRLFLEVCDAVDYLHRRLVVHRDLKPSNGSTSESPNSSRANGRRTPPSPRYAS
jgi:eukaryotic-like serine/threonine-protein kinase